jgi:hypothetical protein
MDEEQIKKEERHIRNAWIAGTILAVSTFIVSTIGAYNDYVRIKHGYDTWSLFDVVLIAGLTYGIYSKNRYCALGMLIYSLVFKLFLAASASNFAGGVGAVIYTYFFFQGTRASFKLHNHTHKEEMQETDKKKGWRFYLLMGFLAIIVIIVGILSVAVALGPNAEVVPGKMLEGKYVDFLRENRLIAPSEQIEFWYSDAFIDFREGFYMFTDKKVLLYNKEWKKPSITIPFSSISDIQFQKEPSFLENSEITLTLSDDSIVFFPLASDNNGDEKFFKRMKQIWKKSKTEESKYMN